MSDPCEMAKGYDTEMTIPIGAIGSRAAGVAVRYIDESVLAHDFVNLVLRNKPSTVVS
jgi:hypothetical protein